MYLVTHIFFGFFQGFNTLNAISIVGVYSQNVKATETESICKQVHNFRDYLIASQIQGIMMGQSGI